MRKDPLEIIEEIFRLLEQESSALSINQIAQKTGLHNITVKKYIHLIEVVRQEPTVEIIKTSHSVIVRVKKEGYTREVETYG
ncbi:MAG TPA: HTH domain-containing protein [archaeon]|nr:HTH domain-containing protein [archaeon]